MPRFDRRLIAVASCLLAMLACNRPASDGGNAPAPAAPAPAPAAPAPGAAPAAPPAAAPAPQAPLTGTPATPAAPEAAPVAAQAPAPTAPPSGATAPPAAAPAAPRAPTAPAAPVRPAPPREITIPAGTPLQLALLTDVSSDGSAVEDRVSARVTAPVRLEGATVIPEGSRVGGEVTYVQGSAKVKGRASLTVRFRTITVGERSYDLDAEPLRREARGTKAKDARNIGIGAGAGAVIGGIIGGRKGAGIGAAVGGAGGTGVVLATKGEEVRLPAGTPVTTRLEAPLVVEMRVTGPPR
ncbi:hypothetical protein TBR22_A47810 [Luteitalea sp. TBR-22]|uniref:hypothetical protein n=1 Tax=Luteitalea sp. TBR-22 TaxID=2802971 RepID=UPI001AFBB2DF|nr:hypothetical protein [Luteitalea sp. TBR-22]BCS35548.1 hypothetical protein TBR22_A47810 [Luteitalea sp. TBR-22]